MAKNKTITVRVTEKNIEAGRKASGKGNYCHSCPVAQALKSLGYYASVGTTMVRLGPTLNAVSLPKKVCKFIRNFDHNMNVKKFKPFSFKLKVPIGLEV